MKVNEAISISNVKAVTLTRALFKRKSCEIIKVSHEAVDFDSALKRIHWALVVPSFVMILFAPYATYLICRQVEKSEALERHHALIQSAAVIVCLLTGNSYGNSSSFFDLRNENMIKKF